MQQTLSENITKPGERNVTYPIKGQEDGQGYITSEPKEGSIGIVMIQEWWGMNKSITLTAETFAKAGNFVVLTPDLYRGKVAQDREEAGHYMGGLDWPGAIANISAAVQYLKSKGCKKVGVCGFCMGGALTIATAANCEDIDAAVPFYGVPDLSKVPVEKIKCPVFAHFAEKDQAKGFSDCTARDNLEAAFKKGGVKYEIKTWPGVDHAFMNADGPNYNPEVAKQALAESCEWFNKQLNN